MNKRFLPAQLLPSILVLFALLPQMAQAGTNLLVNPSFEYGYYHASGIPELAVPNSWQIHYLDGAAFPGIADGYVARRPETVVWSIQDAPVSERSLFFQDGNYTLKVFKPWAPLYAGLSQDVNDLEVGAQYEFVANVYVDVVDHYAGGAKVPPNNEPDGVKLRTGASILGAAWRNEQQINYSAWSTAGNTAPFHQTFVRLRQSFTATAPQMTVWVEMVSRYAYVNNGFFMDRFELSRIAAPPATPTATLVVIASTPAPTAISVPTSVPAGPTAPAPTRYVVRRGDTLSRIARRLGTTTAALAAANGIINYNFIYTGQRLAIPAGAVISPTAPAQPPLPAAATASPPPAPATGTYVVQRGDTLSGIAARSGTTTAALAAANGIADYNRIYTGQLLVMPGAARLYTVQRGDKLAFIAARFGTTVAAMQAANNLSNINTIYVGQVLKIP